MQPAELGAAERAEIRARSEGPHESGLARPAQRRLRPVDVSTPCTFDRFLRDQSPWATRSRKRSWPASRACRPSRPATKSWPSPISCIAYDFPGYTDVYLQADEGGLRHRRVAEPERFGIFIDHMVPGGSAEGGRAAHRHARVVRARTTSSCTSARASATRSPAEVGYADAGRLRGAFRRPCQPARHLRHAGDGLRRNVLEAFVRSSISMQACRRPCGSTWSARCSPA